MIRFSRVITVPALVVSLLLSSAIPSKAHDGNSSREKDTYSQYRGLLPDQYYDGLATCETNHNWQHSARSYTGGLGIYRGTWQRWSDSNSAEGRTPRYQVIVADRIAFLGFTEPDGHFVSPVGPYGWGCVRIRARLRAYICASRNKAVIKRKRNC